MAETQTETWQERRQREINTGEICRQCLTWIFNSKGPPGHAQLCSECKGLEQSDEVTHSELIRCPKCRSLENPGECDSYEAYGDGEHQYTCGSCGHTFEITTHVSYLFVSPPLLEDGEAGEE